MCKPILIGASADLVYLLYQYLSVRTEIKPMCSTVVLAAIGVFVFKKMWRAS